ncbi:MAG: cytidylyltransferase family protein [Desulfurococcales archaeon]|nr:cytidylyltransferase family protein [Desulfurococcales archaeon]
MAGKGDRISRERVERYIHGVQQVLTTINVMSLDVRYQPLIDAAKRYLEDAKYYFHKGDLETSLVNIAYAEGLIDSLKYMEIIEPRWPHPKDKPKRVVVAGTFDLIHPGHLELFRYASKFGDLYVIVSRDVNAEKAKGRPLVLDESTRLEIVSSLKYVKKAMLGDPMDIFKPLEQIKPDIVVLGPDQRVKEEDVKREMEQRIGYSPQVLRYPEKKKHGWIASSSDIIERICVNIC